MLRYVLIQYELRKISVDRFTDEINIAIGEAGERLFFVFNFFYFWGSYADSELKTNPREFIDDERNLGTADKIYR